MIKEVVLKSGFIKAFFTFLSFSLVIIAVASYLVFKEQPIGPAFLFLGFISIALLYIFKIPANTVYPDMIFGAIDNGILVLAAILGGSYGGVAGAVIGGAAGNTITDGIGGLFEGHIAENQRKYQIDNLRTALSTSLGKMSGCLFGAGAGLIIVDVFKGILVFF